MKRLARTWMIFAGAIAVAFAVMLFFTVKMLEFEKRVDAAQSHAALEETVRLALWRIDSAAALMLATTSGTPPIPNERFSLPEVQVSSSSVPVQTQNAQRIDPAYQQAISAKEFGQRETLASETSLDWRTFQHTLLAQVQDILPDATLEEVANSKDRSDPRRLATIPARLVVPATAMPTGELPWNTPLRISLMVAWACALIGALAAWKSLAATLSLSERRGAFASAVTHELRTPLTTFRLYSEMLASGMVPDEATRTQYLQTLVTESDRLGHLIENVLAYARLENRSSSARTESLTVAQLIDRVKPTLQRRADHAGFSLIVSCEPDIATMNCRTDSVATQQILLNLLDNTCKYGKPPIELTVREHYNSIEFEVADHGPGLGASASRPFVAFNKAKTDPVPGIGLGLYLSRQIARDLGGNLIYKPREGLSAFVLSLPALV